MISKELADFFIDQCFGSHNGHMAPVPNNPTLQGLARAHGVVDRNGEVSNRRVKAFLREIYDRIETE